MSESTTRGDRPSSSAAGSHKGPAKKMPFEKALARLEEIVEILESGESTLEKSLALFEEGALLSHRCNRQLNQAERKLEILVEKAAGKTATEPFPEEEFFPADSTAGDEKQ